MIEADPRVSTPRTDSSSIRRLSRRKALAGLVLLPAIVPAVPVATEPDPAFALIAAKRSADVAHCKAIDAQDEAEYRYGFRSDEAFDAFE